MAGNKKSPIIIGFVSKGGCGKDACSKYLVKKYGGKEIVMSGFISEALGLFHIRLDRVSVSWFIRTIRKRFGKGILAKAVTTEIEEDGFSIYILNGIRIMREVEILREKFGKNFILVDIFCDDKIRFERIKARQKKSSVKKDKTNISLEEFLKWERRIGNEKEIPSIEKKADYTINNSGTIKDLYKNLDKLIKIYKK